MTSPLVGRSSSGAFQMSPLLFGGSPDFGGKSTPENVKTSSDRAALKGALRREASAVEDLGKCKEQLREMSNLLSLKDKDHQRFNMIIRLREGKIKRLEESEAGNVPEEVRLLQQELLLWKEKAEHHPEVTRYAMDNLQLKESLAEMRKFTGGERETLLDEVAVLRAKTLELLESEKEMEDVETVAARVAAASAAQIEQAAAHHEQVSAALGVQLEAARGQAEGARAEMDRLREEVWQLRSTLEDKSVELLDAKVAADEAAQSHARIVSGLENELMSEQEANGTLTQEVAALQRALEALRSESNARLEAASAEATASLDELRSQLSQVHFELEDKAMLEVSLSHAEHCANAIQAELDSVLQVLPAKGDNRRFGVEK
jgi:kinesin family protein 15